MMAEKSKKEKQAEWACRILITVNVVMILAGYLSYFQTKRQLVSPLIPKSTVYQIMADGGDSVMKASIIAAAIFLAGLWCWSFNQKKAALILFCLSPVLFSIKAVF